MRSWRFMLSWVLLCGSLAGAAFGGAKVDVCHRTGSATNPHVLISVSDQAVKGHLGHGDFLWDPLRYDTSCNLLANCGDAPETAGTSCRLIKDACGPVPDGVYWVDPAGAGSAFQVYCDMTLHGGGWALVAAIGEAMQPTDFCDSDRDAAALTTAVPAPSTWAHLNLHRFDAYASTWTIRAAVDAFNDQSHFQYVFYRPGTPSTLTAADIGSVNWTTSPLPQELVHLTMSTTTGLSNTTWLGVPPCLGGHCDNCSINLFTYRDPADGGDCLDGSGQTRICHSVGAPITCGIGGTGSFTSAFGMLDDVSHMYERKATYWIKDVNTAGTP